MARYLFSVFVLFMFISCSSDDNRNECRYLLNVGVNYTINMNLPEYSQLQFTSNSVYVPNQGNLGFYVINVGSGYRAFDAADPNHTINGSCSFLQREGVEVTCQCEDENTYYLFTGQAKDKPLPCGLKEYRVSQPNATTLVITN
ncbi:Rieske (2Fe-2S) protein [Aegicerativicinus sediminis]|uniref:hypothetical protein n=1 Tax=Aegicerativicinus sediminis TaxID=2893202 RepID=UPI001E3B370D|nr:hypothetical protein [Aegicerativicinus sediminis]